MPVQSTVASRLFDRDRFERLAGWLAVALAVSLPWSTSATSILAALWLLALVPTLDVAAVRCELKTAAGGLPVLLWALGVAGMLWADVPWSERLQGLGAFHKLLVIPLLLAQFRRSDRGREVLLGFLASCTVLLIVSWTALATPSLPWPSKNFGIVVKDYISQSAMFTICILVMAAIALDAWHAGRRMVALALTILVVGFIANILFIATSRTALVVVPILLLLFGFVRFGWKGAAALLLALAVLVAAAWPLSGYLRDRMHNFVTEVVHYRSDGPPTSAGERLEFWRKSIGFVAAAPVIGHGTGSIHDQFRRAVVGSSIDAAGVEASVSDNPHNQTFGVAIQLGLVGAAVLWAMWIAHLLLFRGPGLAAWVGLAIVAQNVLGSLFNSHLFDFTHGWAYVIGVGVAGGIVLREAAAGSRA